MRGKSFPVRVNITEGAEVGENVASLRNQNKAPGPQWLKYRGEEVSPQHPKSPPPVERLYVTITLRCLLLMSKSFAHLKTVLHFALFS